MTSQSRFHFLNLWDEKNDSREIQEGDRDRSVSELHSAGAGPVQVDNSHPVSGKWATPGL